MPRILSGAVFIVSTQILFIPCAAPGPRLLIRAMSKRWGSCLPAGRIILNTELIKAPKGSIEYVIIHELCHLDHHNHTKAFQSLQSRIMSEWRKWKDKLEYSLA